MTTLTNVIIRCCTRAWPKAKRPVRGSLQSRAAAGEALGIFGSTKKRSRDAAAVITGARATADVIVDAGGYALATRCDVSRLDDVSQLAKVAQDWFGGPPSLVVNNAGVGAGGTAIGETDIEDLYRGTVSPRG